MKSFFFLGSVGTFGIIVIAINVFIALTFSLFYFIKKQQK